MSNKASESLSKPSERNAPNTELQFYHDAMQQDLNRQVRFEEECL
jgi:hypothetical protein